MTHDKRVEAAARAIGHMLGDETPGEYLQDARIILAAADAVDPLRQNVDIPELPINTPIRGRGKNERG
ncbi:MAG: hypothetical protein ABF990_12060 [Acetobacter sp.]|uniref:hypothetical protein n=1 Tax=Acetobacter sp. TaxID=440 RepID=UPI0039EA0A0B